MKKGALFWSFLPLGGMVGWLVPGMSGAQLMVCVLLYGFLMMFAGMMVGLAHSRENEAARIIKAAKEAKVTQSNSVQAARHVVAACSDVIAFSVADRMVEELVPHKDNEEQMVAARATAMRVAAEESTRVKGEIGVENRSAVEKA
jgi:hypothetical protein